METTSPHESAVHAEQGAQDRPYFAHVRMTRGRSVIVVLVVLVTMVVAPASAAIAAALLEMARSTDGAPPSGITPLGMVLGNVAAGLAVPVTLLTLRFVAKVPPRAVFAAGRAFSWRRLLGLFCLLVVPLCIVMVVVQGIVGFPVGGIEVTPLVVTMLVIVVLTVPLQATGEEVAFRGGIGNAVGSWARSPRRAVVGALVISSALFGAIHFGSDPWLMFYYPWLGLVFGALALVTRGLEAPIALHVANNVATLGAGVLFSSGGQLVVDRTDTGGNETMLIVLVLVPLQILFVGVLYLTGRRKKMAACREG